MALLSKLREMANKNEVEFTSSQDDYNQWKQAMMQPRMAYTKAAIAQGNQAAMQVLMDNPDAWMLYAANVRQDACNPLGAMDVEMSIKFLDPAVCHQFYGVLSGVIQSQPLGGMPAWNPSLTITVPRLDDEDDEDEDTKSSFRTQDEGKYVTSFKEAM